VQGSKRNAIDSQNRPDRQERLPRILDHARQYVRQRLVESGCRFMRPATA
jgi:hypothetical protein